MEIYVVQPGDSIESIAQKYNTSVIRLNEDNGLINTIALVTGQALVILYPDQIYTVQDGDSLVSIAAANGITLLQLLRNNPTLNNRSYLYPGETLIIRYNSVNSITTNGYAYSFIDRNILKKTLPYLSYLSVFNYRSMDDGSIITYGDDTELIQLANVYKTVPLLMISSLSPLGELNIEFLYELLLNDAKNALLIQNILNTIQSKGFKGVNVLISNINMTNQKLYINFLTKLSEALKQGGYTFIATMNPNIKNENGIAIFEKLDYNTISQLVNQLVFIQYVWGVNKEPPGPINSITMMRTFLDYIKSTLSMNNTSLGKPLIGYDWELPYIPGKTVANAMTLDSTLMLARNNNAIIEFDVESQTPFFRYYNYSMSLPTEHIVWFIDARSIKALDDLIIEYNLAGSGIWNINNYNQQLWSIINARFNITRITPET